MRSVGLLRPFRTEKGISYLGGVWVFLVFISTFLGYIFFRKIVIPPQLAHILFFSFVILTIEFFDDIRNFSLRTRVITQLIFVFLFLIAGKKMQVYFLPPWLNYTLSFLWIMGVTNTFNLMDIADGLCAGVSLIISIAFVFISFICNDVPLTGLFTILSIVVFVFLLFNLPPAKIYLGNSGSHFLGFVFASLAMYGDYASLKNVPALLTPFLVLAVPIVDTMFLIVIRLKKRMLPIKKSDDHIFLRLVALGTATKRALCLLYLLTLLWCLAGIFVVLKVYFLFVLFLLSALLATGFVILKASHQVLSTRDTRPAV